MQRAAGASLALPPEAVAYLDWLGELQIPVRKIDGERDAWILVAAQLPDRIAMYIHDKREQVEDPSVVESSRGCKWHQVPRSPRSGLPCRGPSRPDAAGGSGPQPPGEARVKRT